MAKDCLVTKLAAEVDNAAIKKLGTLYIEFTNSSFNASAVIGLNVSTAQNESVVVTGVDNALYNQSGTNLGNEVEVTQGSSATWICPGGGTVEISNKYVITYFNVPKAYVDAVDTIDLFYCRRLLTITSPLKGELSNLPPNTTLSRLDASRSSLSYDLVGSLADMPVYPNLKYLGLMKNRSVTGNISALGGFVSLTELMIGDVTSVTGSVESFVAAQRTAGRTTCSGIACPYIGTTSITFNGASIPNASNTSISWTATTITCGGTTIDA